MDVRTTARRVKVTPAVQEHLEQRIGKMRRYVPELDTATVKLSTEKHRYQAEILLHVRQKDRVAQEEADDLIAAIDGAATRLERQLRRLKDRGKRSTARREANGSLRRSAARAALETTSSERPTGAAKGRSYKAVTENPSPTVEAPEIVRVAMPEGKPLSPEEAVEQLLESNLDFLVFIESKKERPCVLYRRKNGTFGLIETGG